MNESKGALTEAVYYILISLYEPLHGYGVIQNVERLSGGRVRLGAGTLYGAINTLLSRGWIVECGEAGERKKEYVITESGKRAVLDETDRLRELLDNGTMILEKYAQI
jgi:Predicted transcriptional regulators